MADASKRPPSSSQRQSPPTSLAHRTRAPQHARRQPSPSSGPRDAAAGIHGANHAAAADDDDDDDEDYTSSSGSDSDSDGAESDDENDGRLDRDRTRDGDGDGDGDGNDGDSVPHVSGRAKPRIHRVQDDQGLMARLSAFLPQMKTANEDLQREIDAGRAMDVRLDEVDEQSEGRYIEMNLGLGVLEEQHSDDEDKGTKPEGPKKDSKSETEHDSNVMDTLMGNDESPSSKKPTIQEL